MFIKSKLKLNINKKRKIKIFYNTKKFPFIEFKYSII
jgi:hypothetical protein